MDFLDAIKNNELKLYINELIEKKAKKRIKELQKWLVNLGYNLKVDGILGPITAKALSNVDSQKLATNILQSRKIHIDSSYPLWIQYAIEELGVKEVRGKGSNPRVEQYHDAVGLPWAKDDVPWCGAFVGFCMLKAGYKIPKDAARALSWLDWEESAKKPVFGAVAVKKRKGGGHVTFVVGKEGDILYCLGGNQHDEVCVSKYRESVFVDFRIPKDYTPTTPLTKWESISKKSIKES